MSGFTPQIEALENGNLEMLVGEEHLAKIGHLIEKHNRRAQREGISQRVEVVRDAIVSTLIEGVEHLVHEIEIEVPVLVKDGWKMVAALDFIESGVVVRTVPGESLEGWERPESQTCDHCGTKRFRNRSFVVRSEAGEVLQVGSSCLTAFIGFSPAMALRWMTFADEIVEESESWGGCYVPRFYSVDSVVRMAHVVSEGGRKYIPAGAFDKVTTSEEVRNVLHFVRGYGRDREEQEREVAEMRAAAAALPADEVAEIIEFGKALEGDSDYVQNLRVILNAESITGRHIGILSSLLKVWAKDQEREAECKANPVVSEWLDGEVKQRLRGLKVIVTKVQCWEGDYGLTTLVIFRTGEGRTVKWFASGAKDIEVGDNLVVDATIKKFEEYNGVKQTVVTRATIKS